MNVIKILLKREFSERFSSLRNKKKDIVGSLFGAMLIFLVVFVFVAVFMYVTKTYALVKVGYVAQTSERIFEVLTVFWSIIAILLIVMGIAKLNKNLIGAGNASLLHLPISPFQIFVSKMIWVYIELFATCLILSVPVTVMFAIQGYVAGWAIIISIILSLFMPMIALGVASFFTIPYYYIKKWINKKFVIQLLVYIAIMICAFVLYSVFLKLVQKLMESGQIAYFFNEDCVTNLGNFAKCAYPVKFFSSVVAGRNVALNLLFVLLCSAVGGATSFLLNEGVFQLVRQNKLNEKNEFSIRKKPRKPRNVVCSLMGKEFINVLRTPRYAFNYYAILLSLPLMVVITTNILFSMMKNLTIFNCDFEIVLCVVCMYSILLNSFCSNNISRDGKFYNLMKTYPVSPKQVIFSKIWFCSITSGISILITGATILISGQLTLLKTLAVVVVALVLNFGVICIATRKDLNTVKYNSATENSQSTNFLIFWGLVFAVGLTVLSFVLSITLQIKFGVRTANYITCLILLCVSVIVAFISILYLLRKLDKKYKETTL